MSFVREVVREALGDEYDALVRQVSSPGTFEEVALTDPFDRGFETAKKVFDPEEEAVAVVFNSTVPLQRIAHIPNLRGFSLTVPSETIAAIFDGFLDKIFDCIDNQIQQIEARRHLLVDREVQIVPVGGGSRSAYIYNAIFDRYTAQEYIVERGKNAQSTSVVAFGALLTAVDPELGQRDFSRTSFGTAFNIAYQRTKHRGIKTFPAPDWCNYTREIRDRVFWGVKMDVNLNDPEQPMVVTGEIQIEEEYVYQQRQSDGRIIIDLEMVIHTTNDASIGKEDDQSLQHRSIKQNAGVLAMDVDLSQVQFQFDTYGIQRYLVFEVRGVAKWDGLRLYWHFVTHKSRKIPAGAGTYEYLTDPDYIWKELQLKEVLRYKHMENDEDHQMSGI